MRISDWSSDVCSSDLRSITTIKTAITALVSGNWIEVRRIGENGTVNAYVLNDRVVWSGPREGLRYSLFSATVVVSDSEQPDRDTLGKQEPLRRLPPIGERQLPHGDGLPTPSQPFLDGIEQERKSTRLNSSQTCSPRTGTLVLHATLFRSWLV